MKTYDNESISSLKGADRVRKKLAVIFSFDDIWDIHYAFKISSN